VRADDDEIGVAGAGLGHDLVHDVAFFDDRLHGHALRGRADETREPFREIGAHPLAGFRLQHAGRGDGQAGDRGHVKRHHVQPSRQHRARPRAQPPV
jgi:hypothetical protein